MLPGRTTLDVPANFLAGKKGVQWEIRQGMNVVNERNKRERVEKRPTAKP